MTFSILFGNNFSSSTRIYMLSLIVLVLVCSFSSCSSSASSFGSSSDEIGKDVDNIKNNKNLKNGNDNNYHQRLPFRSASSAVDYFNDNDDEDRILSKERLLNLLLKSALAQEEGRPHRQHSVHIESRRYVPQSFHAMRG